MAVHRGELFYGVHDRILCNYQAWTLVLEINLWATYMEEVTYPSCRPVYTIAIPSALPLPFDPQNSKPSQSSARSPAGTDPTFFPRNFPVHGVRLSRPAVWVRILHRGWIATLAHLVFLFS